MRRGRGLRGNHAGIRHTGPACSNCGAGWDREQTRGRETCPRCEYPFREYQTPLHTGEEHFIEDYVDVEEWVEVYRA